MNFDTRFAGTFVTIQEGRLLKNVPRIQCRGGATVAFVVFNNDDHKYRLSISEIGLKYNRKQKVNPFLKSPAQEIAPNSVTLMIGVLKPGYEVKESLDYGNIHPDPNLVVYGLYKYSLLLEGGAKPFALDPDLEVDDPMSSGRQ